MDFRVTIFIKSYEESPGPQLVTKLNLAFTGFVQEIQLANDSGMEG